MYNGDTTRRGEERESEKRWEGGKKEVIIFEVIRAENQR